MDGEAARRVFVEGGGASLACPRAACCK
jgi:hypothetical protein